MKRLFFVFYSVAFVFQFTQAQMTERDTVFNRFRSITIQNKQSISLQSKIESIKEFVAKTTDDHYCLKKGSFVRADSIDIEVDLDKKILAIAFFYDTTYVSKKSIYNKPLGAGREFLFCSESFTFKATQWEDKLTIFELIEVVLMGEVKVYSVIFDKALYLGKYKNCLGAFNTDYSYELFRKFLGN